MAKKSLGHVELQWTCPNCETVNPGLVKVCEGCIIASVPSKEDDNPDHIHLFTEDQLKKDFLDSGATSVKVEYVLNSMIIYARCDNV